MIQSPLSVSDTVLFVPRAIDSLIFAFGLLLIIVIGVAGYAISSTCAYLRYGKSPHMRNELAYEPDTRYTW